MARPIGEGRIEVAPGVYIYMRDNGVWQVRFRLDGARDSIRKSLRTKDPAVAKKRALDMFDQARLRQKLGKPEHAVSFKGLCTEYLASKPKGQSKTYHEGTIRRHLSPFFDERLPDVSEISAADVADYLQWRRSKGKGSKEQTLNRENVVLRGLIKFAVTKGYLPKDSAPEVVSLKAKNARRDNFTREELETFVEIANARIDVIDNAVTREQRQLLHDWIVVLANTGLRTGEARALQWSDVFLDVDQPYLHIKAGKTKARDVVPLNAAIDSLNALRSRQQLSLSTHGKKLTKRHFVFSLFDPKRQDLKQVKNFKTGFNNLLKACAFSDGDRETSLSPYSLRHSYATMRIEEGTNIYLLAKQMGTGVKMIEDHYGHVMTREQRAELTKTRGKSQSKSSVPNDVSEKFDAIFAALKKGNTETPTQVVRQQILEEWKADNGGQGPIPGSQLHEILFEGFVQDRLKKLGYE